MPMPVNKPKGLTLLSDVLTAVLLCILDAKIYASLIVGWVLWSTADNAYKGAAVQSPARLRNSERRNSCMASRHETKDQTFPYHQCTTQRFLEACVEKQEIKTLKFEFS